MVKKKEKTTFLKKINIKLGYTVSYPLLHIRNHDMGI